MNSKLQSKLHDALVEIIRKTSSELPDDIIDSLEEGKKKEQKDSSAEYAMGIIAENVVLARNKSQPLCQDTGTVMFYIHFPMKAAYEILQKIIRKAVISATKKGYLRQNSVYSITGKNSGNNIGPGAPIIHAEPWKKDFYDIRLMMKVGGCEHVGAH